MATHWFPQEVLFRATYDNWGVMMSVASDAVKTLESTASATVHGVEAAGGAAVGAVAGAARGAVEGAKSGARSGVDVPTVTVLGIAAAGLAGLVDWPVAVVAGGVAGAAYLLRRARTGSGSQAAVERPQPSKRTSTRKATSARKTTSTRKKQPTAGSRRSRTAAQ